MGNDATADRYDAARELVRIARQQLTLDELLTAVRRIYIMDAMEDCRFNASQCARILGMHRNTMNRQLRELGVVTEYRRLKKMRGWKQEKRHG